MEIEFGVLGPTVARVDGRDIDLGPARQRSVLAVLLAEANTVVPVEQLAERVWGQAPPHAAATTLRSYLSRLRGALPVALRSRSGGYVLEVDEASVDVHAFHRLVERARAGDRDDARRGALRARVAAVAGAGVRRPGQPVGGHDAAGARGRPVPGAAGPP